MMTVYGYQFEAPKPVEVPRTSPYLWLTVVAAGFWWWWRNKQGKGFIPDRREWHEHGK